MIPTRLTKDYTKNVRGTLHNALEGVKNPFRHHNAVATHPLEIHAPGAVISIRFMRLDYILKSLQAPTPRRQEMPEEAYGVLHENCLLIATSHAWFWQGHPDPEGVKLNILKRFAKSVRFVTYIHTRSFTHTHKHTPITGSK